MKVFFAKKKGGGNWGKLFGGTVPPNNTLFGGPGPPNNTLFGGTPYSDKEFLIVQLGLGSTPYPLAYEMNIFFSHMS